MACGGRLCVYTQVSLDAKVRDVINRNMSKPTRQVFDDAQLQIYTLMQRDSYPRFLASDTYRQLLGLPRWTRPPTYLTAWPIDHLARAGKLVWKRRFLVLETLKNLKRSIFRLSNGFLFVVTLITYRILFHILIMIFELPDVNQYGLLIRVFLGRSYVYSVHWILNQKPKENLKSKNLL